MFNDRKFLISVLLATACIFSAGSVSGQTKRRKAPLKKEVPVDSTVKQETEVTAVPESTPRGKKNERPGSPEPAGRPGNFDTPASKPKPVYFYEFTHPYYLVRKVIIEHDENGSGTIAFIKGNYTEPITDPIQIAPSAMERIKAAFTLLNFLDSKEDYQHQKDFSHLGVMKITMRKNGRTRTSEFNWTANKTAKALTEEYRKLGNQYIWIFDINLARENQPLQAPGLLDELDSLIKRNEVSDAEQMLPFLQKLSLDERVPLIARNHAAKVIARIEKARK